MEHESKLTSAKTESAVHQTSNDPCLKLPVIDPRKTATMRWDSFVMVLLIFTAYVTPYEVAFLSTKMNLMFWINRFVDIVFILDIFKNFLTAYFDDYEQYWVGDHRKIAKKYLSGWFLIDFVSILPFDTVGLAMTAQDETVHANALVRFFRVLRLLKMTRLVRSIRILSTWQDMLGVTHTFKVSGLQVQPVYTVF
jgi:potassium voltage-gated channel Eag-related subfamily H protein 7